MSVVQIPNLTPAISVAGPEMLEAVQGGQSVRVTISQIQANLSVGAFETAVTAWFLTLPTSYPGTANTWWNNGGTLAYTGA